MRVAAILSADLRRKHLQASPVHGAKIDHRTFSYLCLASVASDSFLLFLGTAKGRHEAVIKCVRGSQAVPQDKFGHPSSISQ